MFESFRADRTPVFDPVIGRMMLSVKNGKKLPKPTEEDLAIVRRALTYSRLFTDIGKIKLEAIGERGTMQFGVVLRYATYRRKAVAELHPCRFVWVTWSEYGVPKRAAICRCGERLEDTAVVGSLCAGCREVNEMFGIAKQCVNHELFVTDDVKSKAFDVLAEAKAALFDARAVPRPLREFEEAAKRPLGDQYTPFGIAALVLDLVQGTMTESSKASWESLFSR